MESVELNGRCLSNIDSNGENCTVQTQNKICLKEKFNVFWGSPAVMVVII